MIHNPIALYEIAEMRHRERVAKVNQNWRLELNRISRPAPRPKGKLALMVTGITLTMLLLGQGLAL
jgi:hypothetical protein